MMTVIIYFAYVVAVMIAVDIMMFIGNMSAKYAKPVI